jgi:hypothetical protein
MILSPFADSEAAPSPPGTSAGRAFFLARQVGRFASVQMLVQLIGFTTGILLVRRMEQREYALFTVANTGPDRAEVATHARFDRGGDNYTPALLSLG